MIESIVLAHSGAWNWCLDPRAVFIDGHRCRTYSSWVTREGQLQVGAYDHETGDIETAVIKQQWDGDDHNSASFLVLPDRRLMIFYARHNKPGLYCRTMSRPEDISRWRSKVTISDGRRLTYSHPVFLREEGLIYLFWRGENWKPAYSTSANGRDWSPARTLIRKSGSRPAKGRPYLKVASDGVSSIHFAFTDGHPRNEAQNSIYYFRYEAGECFRADGIRVASINALPLSPEMSDRVYDGSTHGRAWIWDIALDASGHPVILYVRMPSEDDHRYHYARWDGERWLDTELVAAGGWFPQTPDGRQEPEPHYSGGLTLDPADPSTVYLSRHIDDVFRIEQWRTPDGGRSWTSKMLSGQSGARCVRPVVPRGHPGPSSHLLWMEGDYRYYTDFQTRIVMGRVS